MPNFLVFKRNGDNFQLKNMTRRTDSLKSVGRLIYLPWPHNIDPFNFREIRYVLRWPNLIYPARRDGERKISAGAMWDWRKLARKSSHATFGDPRTLNETQGALSALPRCTHAKTIDPAKISLGDGVYDKSVCSC